MEMRVNNIMYRRLMVLGQFLGNRKLPNDSQGIEPRKMKFETDIIFNTINLQIVDDRDQKNLKYIGDIHNFKL